MTQLIASGIHQKLFSVDCGKQPYNNDGEMNPYGVQKYIVRTTDENTIHPEFVDIA